MTVLLAHVQTGEWASVVPATFAASSRLTNWFSAIPICEPDVVHTIGLVMPLRDPTTPLAAALAAQARRTAAELSVERHRIGQGYADGQVGWIGARRDVRHHRHCSRDQNLDRFDERD